MSDDKNKLPEELAGVVTPLLETIREQLGPVFSLEALHTFVEQQRGKPIYVEHKLVDIGLFGATFELLDAAVIQITPGLVRRLYVSTYSHELIHILRKAAKCYSFPYSEYIKSQNELIATNHTLGVYAEFEEDVAETVASKLSRCILEYEGQVPRHIRNLYQ